MDMDMGSMSSMSMPTTMAMAAASAASATSTAMASMAGMDMGGETDIMPAMCNMQMIWNWDVVDECFIAGSWRITSNGMFAGSCVGVVFFVVALEFWRRLIREYNRLIVRQWQQKQMSLDEVPEKQPPPSETAKHFAAFGRSLGFNRHIGSSQGFSPSVFQQLVRSVLYGVMVGAGYILMLLAMSFNGYIIICIIIGAMLGYFFFGSDIFNDSVTKEAGISCC